MKICPRCQKTYSDDNLNFCLEDGSVLAQASAPPPTMPSVGSQGQYGGPQSHPGGPQSNPGGGPGSQPGISPQWNAAGQPQNYGMQAPRKSSKTWLWVLLILCAVVLLCGGGVVGLIIYGSQQANQFANTVANIANTANVSSNRGTSSNTSGTNSSSSSRTSLETIDLEPWVKPFSVYGTTEYTNDELIMGSKQKGYYYVLAAPDEADYHTDDADTKVTVRNLNDATSSMGYGLVFHSNPTPLQQGYAFLIDTKRKKYRVVHHTPGDEKVDVPWTASPAIKGGTEENVLEVHDLADKVELYINGTMVKSITNTYGYAGGIPGLYSGDGIKVAFKNLEVRR
jgi:hypothetical protein